VEVDASGAKGRVSVSELEQWGAGVMMKLLPLAALVCAAFAAESLDSPNYFPH
jgi:hypothetical protein